MAKKTKGKKGNGNGNGGTVIHPWAPPGEPLSEEMPLEPPREMDEDHVDCQGRKRHFRLREYHRGMISFLDAVEVIDGEMKGARIVLLFNDETEVPPYGAIRGKIEERLATRDLVKDPESGELTVLNMRIRGQVTSPEEDDGTGPDLIIDDQVISWRVLGRLLRTYEGWGLRIEIKEPGEE